MTDTQRVVWRDGKRYILDGDNTVEPLTYILDTQRAVLDTVTDIQVSLAQVRDELPLLRARIEALNAGIDALPGEPA